MDGTADREKLVAAIAFLVAKAPEALGKVQLFKLLYLADFTAYEQFGSPITGETYENFEGGPVPKLLWARYRSITAECVEIRKVGVGMRFPKQEMHLKPGLDTQGLFELLSDEERDILEATAKRFGKMTGTDLKHHTHRELPYRLTTRGEEIPYYLAHYRHFEKPTDEEVDRFLKRDDVREALAELEDLAEAD